MCVCVKGRDVHVARRSDIYNTCYLQHDTKMTTMKSYGERLVCVCEIQRERERWGAGVETQKNVRGVFGGWGRVPFNEPYAPSLSTIYDGA